MQLQAAIYPQIDSEFLFESPKPSIEVLPKQMESLLPVKVSKRFAEEFAGYDALRASLCIPLYTAHCSNLTGTVDFVAFLLDGKPFKNAFITSLCHGEDAQLFRAICHYCGCGVAESFQVASDDEAKVIELRGFCSLWEACLVNLCSCCSWHNQSVRSIDDPGSRFRLVICDDAFQATWDALSHFLMIPPTISEGPWSEPDSPSQWAKRFRISTDTFKRRIDDGSIRHKKLSTKSYRIHVDELPPQ